jgi:hypothetical protein
MDRKEQKQYLEDLYGSIKDIPDYNQDVHTGAITYIEGNNNPIYCSPAWEQFEDILAVFPEDNNVKIDVEYLDENDYTIHIQLDFYITFNLKTDVDNFHKIMNEYLKNKHTMLV